MAGIYIHIPFCRRACTYCNFHFSTSLQGKAEMLQAIAREAELRKDELTGQAIETVYFGGGTPSLLTPEQLAELFEGLAQHYDLSALRECTLEANPDDLSREYVHALRDQTPIDRLSIGIQSFRDEDLRYTHRVHSAEQAENAVKTAQDAGFSNLSIDLIYGIPGLSDQAWMDNLARAESLGVQHLSSYALTVEEGTALHHAIEKKSAAPVEPEQSAQQFRLLMDWARGAGYEHYEISNLAKPGHRALHNTSYWLGVPYLGLGPSAHSFDGENSRRWNVANNALYTRGILDRSQVLYEEEHLTRVERLNEYIMTSLRTAWGLDIARVETEWDAESAEELQHGIARFVQQGLARSEQDSFVLTDKGKLFADGIAAELFLER
jgi:oxygen-independent coproporphyrinogen-3 oxidase